MWCYDIVRSTMLVVVVVMILLPSSIVPLLSSSQLLRLQCTTTGVMAFQQQQQQHPNYYRHHNIHHVSTTMKHSSSLRMYQQYRTPRKYMIMMMQHPLYCYDDTDTDTNHNDDHDTITNTVSIRQHQLQSVSSVSLSSSRRQWISNMMIRSTTTFISAVGTCALMSSQMVRAIDDIDDTNDFTINETTITSSSSSIETDDTNNAQQQTQQQQLIHDAFQIVRDEITNGGISILQQYIDTKNYTAILEYTKYYDIILQQYINTNNYTAILEYTKYYDIILRKQKIGSVKKFITSYMNDDSLPNSMIDKNIQKDILTRITYICNAITFDLIGMNRSCRRLLASTTTTTSNDTTTNLLELQKYFHNVQSDIEQFLVLENDILQL